MINKQESRYMLYASLFAFGWFVLALPRIQNNLGSTSPYIQFILFNVGLAVFLQIFLKGITLKKNWQILPIIGLVLLLTAIDIYAPPYSVDFTGNLLGGPMMTESSSDYVAGYAAQSFGLTGISVYLFTYFLVPVLLLLLAAKLLPNFVREL